MTLRYVDVGAVVSDCGQFRPRLWRRWDSRKPVLVFCMLNPSTADGVTDDPTIRKAVGFADRGAYGGIEVVNLFDYRATKPTDLKAAGYPVSPDNDQIIAAVIGQHPDVVCAWGAHARSQEGMDRIARLAALIKTAGARALALRLLADGTPSHPLMLPYSCTLAPFPIGAHHQVGTVTS